MKMLKKKRLNLTRLAGWETLLRSHTVHNVNFSEVRAKLSRMVASSHGFVRVHNRQAGDFFAISVDEMNKFLTELAGEQGQSASFFDGMDEFESRAPVPYSRLAGMDGAAPEYSNEDIETLRARVGAARGSSSAAE